MLFVSYELFFFKEDWAVCMQGCPLGCNTRWNKNYCKWFVYLGMRLWIYATLPLFQATKCLKPALINIYRPIITLLLAYRIRFNCCTSFNYLNGSVPSLSILWKLCSFSFVFYFVVVLGLFTKFPFTALLHIYLVFYALFIILGCTQLMLTLHFVLYPNCYPMLRCFNLAILYILNLLFSWII